MESSLIQSVEKANILTEALPYIRDFYDKIIVVKYGSSVMADKETARNVMEDISLLKLIGMKPVVVHSGSREISRWLKSVGKDIAYIEGNRVTDSETMEIVEMVLGKVNKDLVRLLQMLGVKAVGICGKDNETIKVEKKIVGSGDIGYFGNIKEINTQLITNLIEDDFIPVISSIGINDDFESFNLNADEVACAVAKALKAEKLVFLSKDDGIIPDKSNPESLVKFMTVSKANEIISKGYADSEILPKLRLGMNAVENGVHRVHVINGGLKHSMLLEFFTLEGVGTALTADNTKPYSHETEI